MSALSRRSVLAGAAALAVTMRKPGLDMFRTFNEVGLQVKRATGSEQQPWVSNSSIDRDFTFSGAAQTALLVQPLPAPPLGEPLSFAEQAALSRGCGG